MSANTAPRYQPTYRTDEIDLILRFAARGESLGLVGMAGVGKSNIVNFLRDIPRAALHFGPEVERLHFPVVDLTSWEGTASSLWKLMLGALNQASQKLPSPPEDSKIIAISEEERIWQALQWGVRWVCQQQKHRVMFILDDVDAVFETGPLAMIERLNVLRSEGNRDMLSYLVMTKRLPHVLGRRHQLESKSKFYDLFRHNVYALAPYSVDDARQMLLHLNDVAGKPLQAADLRQILQLAGGHGQLLKIIFNICVTEGAPEDDPVGYFLSKGSIQQECQRILQNLHEEEQQAALRLVRGQQTQEDQDLIDHLFRRGVLAELNPVTWFSPLFSQYLRAYRM